MARKHHYRRRAKEDPAELDITTFLNLMVVLVPFLLITAVFSRIAVVELNLPSENNNTSDSEPPFSLEVIVRESGLELTNGSEVIAAIPNVDDQYDLKTLGDYVFSLKNEYPETNAASILLEPDIAYDYLIQVMDVVRSAEIPVQMAEQEPGSDPQSQELASLDSQQMAPTQMELFPQISIGEAP